MNLKATTVTCFLYLSVPGLVSLTSCKKEALTKKPVFEQIFDRGDILDLAVANSVVCFTREGEQLVVFDRLDSSFTFKSEFNSGVKHVTNIEKLNENQVLVGIDGFGIYAYSSAQDYVRYGAISSITFFDHSRQFCVAQPGILQYQNEWGNFYKIPERLSFEVTANLTSLVANKNTIWLGTPTEGIIKFKPQGFDDSFTSKGGYIADDSIQKMTFDDNDDLWVLTRTGLNRNHDGQWEVYDNPDDVLNNDMTIVENQIYIATNQGVYLFEKGAMKSFDALNERLVDPFVNVVELDERNHFWIGTRKGIYVFRP